MSYGRIYAQLSVLEQRCYCLLELKLLKITFVNVNKAKIKS